MSTGSVLLLGGIAGLTIFLGLPIGRLRNPRPGLRAYLNATAIGVLMFLLVDVFSHALEPVDAAVISAFHDHQSIVPLLARGGIFVGGLAFGLLGLVAYDRMTARRRVRGSFGPGAAAVEELVLRPLSIPSTPARRLAVLIAAGIGMHNFAEGLAIGQSAARGEVNLALVLIIGFGLHNATEGFGIVAPLAGEAERPSWAFLLTLGLIGGGPTFIGTLVGHSLVNEVLFVGFLALAAGSILYVIVELLNVARRFDAKELLMMGLLTGFLVGVATDMVLVAAGG